MEFRNTRNRKTENEKKSIELISTDWFESNVGRVMLSTLAWLCPKKNYDLSIAYKELINDRLVFRKRLVIEYPIIEVLLDCNTKVGVLGNDVQAKDFFAIYSNT